MQNRSSLEDIETNVEEEYMASPANNFALTRELMMQLMSSTQRNPLRPPIENGFFQNRTDDTRMGGLLPNAEGMMGLGHFQQGSNINSGMRWDAFNDGHMVFQPGDVMGNMGNMVQMPAAGAQQMGTASQPFLAALADAGRLPNIQAAANDDDLLTRVLLARRQNMPSNRNQMFNPMFGHDTAADPATQSLTDELLWLYGHNMDMAQHFLGQQSLDNSFQQMQRSAAGNNLMGQPPPYGSNSGVRPATGSLTNSVPTNLLTPRQFQDMMQVADGSTISDYNDMPQRIEPSHLPLQDIVLRDPVDMMGEQKSAFDESKSNSSFSHHNPRHMATLTTTEIEKLKLPTVSRKRRRPQRKKPADMPRRPLSAYNLFFSEERERILHEISSDDSTQPDSSTSVAQSRLHQPSVDASGDATNPLSAATACAGVATVDKSEGKPCQALLRPIVPAQKKRRPHRKTHGKISFKLLAQMVGQRWKSISDHRRQYYQDLADEDMKRHKVAMEEYYKRQATAKGAGAAKQGKQDEDSENDESEDERSDYEDGETERKEI